MFARVFVWCFCSLAALGAVQRCGCSDTPSPSATGGYPAVVDAGPSSLDASLQDAALPSAPDAAAPTVDAGAPSVPLIDCYDDPPETMRLEPRHALGWKPSPKGALLAAALPKAVDVSSPVCWLPNDPDDLDQDGIGMCAGASFDQCLSTQPFPRHATFGDGLLVYQKATKLDTIAGSYPPDDTGTTLAAALAAAKALGWATGGTSASSLLQLRQALRAGPGAFGSPWTEDDFTPNRCGKILGTGPDRGGHAYLIACDDPPNARIIFRNSWGNKWGRTRTVAGVRYYGFFWRTYANVEALFTGGGAEAIFPTPPVKYGRATAKSAVR